MRKTKKHTKGDDVGNRPLDDQELDCVVGGTVRLDPTPARISTNVTLERQTPKRDFGDRMKAGLDAGGGLVANGAAVVSAAVSVGPAVVLATDD